jgi:pimeloyl-ACP methyl ester carboxylesterase
LRRLPETDLYVESSGAGERVLLVHGSGFPSATWRDQRALATRYALVMPHRRGYGQSPAADPNFDVDAIDIAALLGDGAHLVGFSYGGVASLISGALLPEAVRSLTVIEPPAFGVASGHPAADKLVDRLRPVYDRAGTMTPEEFDAAFDTALGLEHPPEELDPEAREVADARRRERPPWEAEIPFDALARAAFPKLVVSGGWSAAFDAVCDVVERRLPAAHVRFPEFGGHGVHHADGFNELLERFWRTGTAA